MPGPIPFDLTDVRAGTVWKDDGTFLVISECVITDINRPHTYGSGETAQLERVMADIKFDLADDSERHVATHLRPYDLVHLSGYAWRVSAIHCADRRTLSVRLVRQPEDDQEAS